MSKKHQRPATAGYEKVLGLPRRPGHRREAGASLACFHYQKDEIRRRARQRGWSVSRYLNWLLDQDWVE